MTVTTIKVDSALRDQLKEQAAAAGETLGSYVQRLADSAARDARFADLKRAVESTPPELMQSYLQETDKWETLELSDQRG